MTSDTSSDFTHMQQGAARSGTLPPFTAMKKPLFALLSLSAAALLCQCDDPQTEQPAAPAAAENAAADTPAAAPETPAAEPAAESAAKDEHAPATLPAEEEPAAQEAPAAPALPEALQALADAADGGDTAAMNNLALAYAQGQEGLSADPAKAAELYRAAADKGNMTAAFNLARCYALGEGVPADKELFFLYCKKAANGGDTDALYTLGCCYRDGIGTEPDTIEATRWFQRGSLRGHKGCADALKALESE